MLEVHSPIPMLEGEHLIAGISTKHVFHFMIGVGCSTPIMALGLVVLPAMGIHRLDTLFIGVGFGLMFALVPVNNRSLAEWIWLSLRLVMRPKVWLFDREYRIRRHRQEAVVR
ncbi:MAG: hypothetical protein K6T83_00280 [Alicyclobacillus sp.]|nr:hypothetical protein [Alicyclobacillus sp.]